MANDGKGWQRKNMAWARLDDGFGDHPKVLDVIETLDEMAGAAAIGLWSLGLAYAHRTMRTAKVPGYVPRSFARTVRVPPFLGDKLCDAGLWEHAEGGGWIIHDFDQYLPSDGLRSKRAEAGRKGAAARWGKTAGQDIPAGGDSNLPSVATMANGKTCPEPEPESKKKTSSSSSAKRGTRIPEDFAMTPDMIAWGKERYPQLNGDRETEKFVNHFRSAPGAKGVKLDWRRTWENWMHTAAERSGVSRSVPPPRSGHTPYQGHEGEPEDIYSRSKL
jgi:hypothetical protein